MLSGNKGEWGELYALLKLIADKQLQRGDGNLEKIAGAMLPIIKIFREESDGTYEYEFNQNVVVINGNGNRFEFPITEFQHQAKILIQRIKASTKTFEIPEIEEFINSFNCTSLKANSDVKSDIRVILQDPATGETPELGFSIKTQLGNPSTLLNAGKTTNFIYKITGGNLHIADVTKINSIDTRQKVKDRIANILSLGRDLDFYQTENPTFFNNLLLIDSALPRIIAGIVYKFNTSADSSLIDLVKNISLDNPLGFDLSQEHPFYGYKIKKMLTDVALGMMPSKVWTGKLEATGGYLVVREDGEVLAYHIYNRNDFEDYLLGNTKLETASTNRYDFAKVYEDKGEQYIKLNLQIRFIK